MQVPEGCDIGKDKILLLKKLLYKLKEAPKLWNLKFNKFISMFKFKVSSCDDCLYVMTKPNGEKLLLLLYVDNVLLASSNIKWINRIKSKITEKFKCKDLGEVKTFLDMNVDYHRASGILKIDQKNMICKVAKKFRVINCRPIYTPIEEKPNLMKCTNPSLINEKSISRIN
jgi:hypothetical protein